VVFPKLVPHLPTMLLPSEVAGLLDAPDESHYLGLRDKAMLEVLYSTGVKLNELIALDTASLELELSYVQVNGKRKRMVPLTDRAVGLLRRYLAECRPQRVLHPGEPCLFPGRNGTRISRVGVWKLIKKYAQKAGIQRNFNPRTLRHAFAIHLILGGMDLDAIKFLFGYKKLEAAALYSHVNTPDFKAAYQAYHPIAAKE
jgi:integrase/recombinase XerD